MRIIILRGREDMTQSVSSKNNILIVDDTPENLSVLRQLLTERGYVVRPALSGEIALKAIKTQVPDLILLDIMMPGMDGYEVCSILKAEETTAHIPIIFISALTEVGGILKAFQKGGVDYITKPFRTEEVLARVKTHLELLPDGTVKVTLESILPLFEESTEKIASRIREGRKSLLTE